MSNFNEANELASELVYGRTYQTNEPLYSKTERLIFVNGDSTAIVTLTMAESHEEWAEVANVIQRLFSEGYQLGCDTNVGWNGRYDIDGDPEPGPYLPCRKPVHTYVNGRHYCQKHGAGREP